MTEKMEQELFSLLQSINERLSNASFASLRGPIADPSPGFNLFHQFGQFQGFGGSRGPLADPIPGELLGKIQLAKLRVHQIDGAILELKNQISFLEKQKELLKESNKI